MWHSPTIFVTRTWRWVCDFWPQSLLQYVYVVAMYWNAKRPNQLGVWLEIVQFNSRHNRTAAASISGTLWGQSTCSGACAACETIKKFNPFWVMETRAWMVLRCIRKTILSHDDHFLCAALHILDITKYIAVKSPLCLPVEKANNPPFAQRPLMIY